MGFFGDLFFSRRQKAVREALDRVLAEVNDPEANDLWTELLPPEALAARAANAGRAAGPFGLCPENPVPVCGPAGEVVYLSRLLDAQGQKIIFHRLGSHEVEEAGQVLDVYEIVDLGGRNWNLLYFDMYNQHQSDQPPEGFSFGDFEGLCGASLGCPNFPKALGPLMRQTAGSFLGLPAIHPALRQNRAWIKLVRPAEHRQRVEALGYTPY